MWPRPLMVATGTAAGQQELTSTGAGTFTVPPGVYRVSVVAVGGGEDGGSSGGGDGGDLAYINDYAVTPGQEISYYVGAAGEDTWFVDTSTLCAPGGGSSTTAAGDVTRSGGIGRFNVFVGGHYQGGGGGGAAGYSDNGGDGGVSGNNGSNGAGGGGGGGGAGSAPLFSTRGGRGGGVGLQGEGSNGSGGSAGSSSDGGHGTAGSGGSGRQYGGGGGGEPSILGGFDAGYQGAIRVMWGWNRAYPSTNTADV